MTSSDSTPVKSNDYAIVLLAGFAGWERDELLGFKYWGGVHDIEEDLSTRDYETYTAAAGPVSSNWDRACELYAMLRGGQVDYGEAHAARYQHERYGRTYDGLIPTWGDKDAAGSHIRKVHLVGHSQGGQTARVLIQLLEQGSEQERATTSDGSLSGLFEGGKQWVHSATTISTPHDGTTLVYGVTNVAPMIQQVVSLLAAISGAGRDDPVYDFKLDQWNLKKGPDETFADYLERVATSKIWESTPDLSSWDLSIEGARELNSWVKASPDVYYFSWATRSTIEVLGSRWVPGPTALLPFIGTSEFMARYRESHDGPAEAWWPNDGVVNTISMDGPKLDSTDAIISIGSQPILGAWNYMGLMDSYYHADIIGIGTKRDVLEWYRSLADRLTSLPA
jgi:triacylglycerol lipase